MTEKSEKLLPIEAVFDPQKLLYAKLLLDMCPFMEIDTTVDGVEIPVFLKRQPSVILRIGMDPNVLGMPDLMLEEHEWNGTLSFGGVHHHVHVPWVAVRRMWIGEPFLGPMVLWPLLGKKEEQSTGEKPQRGLHLVRDSA